MTLSFSAPELESPGRLLIADDEEGNRQYLSGLMMEYGYQVTLAQDGEEALEKLEEGLPDAVLLDVIMPKVDGYEVCRRIKSDPKTSPIPVLIITALKNRQHRLEGIGAGANDFITKPIDAQEVLLRVRNSIFTKRLLDEVRKNYEEQRRLSQELAARNEELSDFASIVGHDLKSPLSVITGFMQVLKRNNLVLPDGIGLVDQSISSAFEMADFITRLLGLSRAGKVIGDREITRLDDIVRQLFSSMETQEANARLVIQKELPIMKADSIRIKELMQNLLSNAFSNGDPEKGELVIKIDWEEKIDEYLFVFGDNGSGMDTETLKKIFNFGFSGSKKGKARSTGFGLSICKKIVEAHGGRIWAESEGMGKGASFFFTIKK